MSTTPTITYVGHVTHDYYGERIVPGGCVFYGGGVSAALGAQVRAITAWGRDYACRERLASFATAEHLLGEHTTAFVNTYREDATRLQRVEAQAPPLPATMLGAERAEVLHVAPVLDEVDLHEWMPAIRHAKEEGRVGSVALSVQGFARAKRPEGGALAVEHQAWEPGAGLLQGIDMAFLSDEDLRGQEGLLETLFEHIPLVVLTRGEEGASVFEAGREVVQVGIYPTVARDPTGAGDSFAAGFVATWAQGASLSHAAQVAAAAASIIVEGQGPARLDAIHEAELRAREVAVAIPSPRSQTSRR